MLDNLVYRQKVGASLLAGAFLLYTSVALFGGPSHHRTYSPVAPVAGPVIVPQPSGPTTSTVQTTEGWRLFVCHNLGAVTPFRVIPQARQTPDQYTTRSGNVVTYRILTPSHPTIDSAELVAYDITTQVCGFVRK